MANVPDSFWEELPAANERVLILDYDGTLAPFTTDRDHAWPYPGVREALATIRTGGTRVVVISGRSVENARRLLGLEPPPEIWGSHGHMHLLPNGEIMQVPLAETARAALAQGAQSARQLAPGQAVEVKPACVAVHWRGQPPPQARQMEQAVRAAWEPLTSAGVTIHPFDGGLELRSSAADKGSAVNQLLAELGSKAVIAYLGDDLTDEDAFAALAGRGLSVLVRPEWRDTRAQVWLKPPAELLGFLERWQISQTRASAPPESL